ncbi:hypothetical protein FH972_022860 [Carpinus fangiana]|uniref:Zn(2)-C6 fungal-type domain-containing protein n=1 Tax=Carpinus fangiana TaxID=176857 RepID=A0A5N6KTS7_9ROSI|nr:hypothetical protein FH972_022860 [Carpinus fangiana]
MAHMPLSAGGCPAGAEQDAVAESSGEDDDSPPEDHLKSEDDDDAKSSNRNRRHAALSAAQKRRRVTRACDECRRKKIKCDGKQPCTHCTVYSYDCTYDQPSNRRRNPAPQVVEALETRLQRAEALLRVFVPNLDLDDPGIDTILAQGPQAGTSVPRFEPTKLATATGKSQQQEADSAETSLESMVSATGQLDLDERGHWDYHGHSSGLTFLRRMREQFGDIMGPEALLTRSTPFARKHPPPEAMDSPRSRKSSADSPQRSQTGGIGTTELPPKDKALELCSDALDDAGAILRVVHQPTFYKSFHRIYDLRSEDYENEDHQFLPLLYSVIALGCLFGKNGTDVDRRGYQSLTDEGYEYFWCARQLMDITDCRDLTSLQAVVFLILFLQCSAKLSTCYAYIGVALRSAIRMGLHRSFRDNFNPIEAETRKRTFWAIRKMDTYVGAMLGLPLTLSDEDTDQDMPLEVDDEYITATEILPMPRGHVSLIAAANGNFRLSKIVAKIVKSIYPIKGFQNHENNPSRVYSISYSKVRELENELQAWMESLPPIFRPGATAAPHILRMKAVPPLKISCEMRERAKIPWLPSLNAAWLRIETFAKSETMAKNKRQMSKKREAPESVSTQATRSHPDVSQTSGSNMPKRASTFPSHASSPMGQQGPRHTNIAPRPNARSSLHQQNTPPNFYSPSMTPEPQVASFGQRQPNPSLYGGQPFLPSQSAQQMPTVESYPGSMSDLNAMMFPSTDPFAYPNPPMLTLEQNYGADQQRNPFTMSQNQYLPTSTANSTAMHTDDHVDVQLFGPLPSYMMPTSTTPQQTSPALPGFHMPTSIGEEMSDPRRQELWGRQMDELMHGPDWQRRYPDL